MFERYTEKARRVIFFARYEASNFGSLYIESEHLLLGLLREDKSLANHFLKSHAAVDSIRRQIEERSTIREKISTSVDLPLSHECKRALKFGAEESAALGHKHVDTTHLLAGLLREEKCFAAEILRGRGVELSKLREWLTRAAAEEGTAQHPGGKPGGQGAHPAVPQLLLIPPKLLADLNQQAEARGIELQRHVVEMIERGQRYTAAAKDIATLRDTFQQLRNRMEAEGTPWLDAAQLKEEIARRKGMRPAG